VLRVKTIYLELMEKEGMPYKPESELKILSEHESGEDTNKDTTHSSRYYNYFMEMERLSMPTDVL
jgi:hypothetical protein